MYAAQLAAALKARANCEIFGMGGAQMRAAGVEVVTDYSEVSVLGITEILAHLPQLIRAMRRLLDCRGETPARACNPDGLPRLPFAAGPQAETSRCSQRLLHLSAVLGVAAVASAHRETAICAGALHFPIRRKILRRCRRAREIHRPPTGRQCGANANSRSIFRSAWARPGEKAGDDSSREPQLRTRAPPSSTP